MPEPKREEVGSNSKFERQKLRRLHTQFGAAYGSVRILVKASNLPVSKVRPFLHSKPSYTKFTLATRKFRRRKAFARFQIEISCMDLAYVDRIANDNNGFKYLLVCQDLFDRIGNAKGVESKSSEETVRAFLTRITEKNRTTKIWLYKERYLLDSVIKFAKLKEYKVTLQRARLRLHLLNVQYDPWKVYLTVIWKHIDTSTFTNCLNLSLQRILKNMLARPDTKECQDFQHSVHSIQ